MSNDDFDDIDINDLSKYSTAESRNYTKIEGNLDRFTQLQIDALAELGNIGVGAASIAYSKFLNRDVSMSLPRIIILSLMENKEYAFFPEEEYKKDQITLIQSSIVQPDRFELLCIIDKRSIDGILSIIFQNFEPKEKLEDYTPLEKSLVKEMGSILNLHYVAALNKLLNKEYVVSHPETYYDNLQSCVLKAQKTVNRKFKDITFTDLELAINLDIWTIHDDLKFNLTILPSNDTLDSFLVGMDVS